MTVRRLSMKLLLGLARSIRSHRKARRRPGVDLGDMGATSALDAALPRLDDAVLAESRRRREHEPDAGGGGRVTRPGGL